MQKMSKQNTHIPIRNKNRYKASRPLGLVAAEIASSSKASSSQAATEFPKAKGPK